MSSSKRSSEPFYVYEITRYHDHVKNHKYQIGQLLGEGGFAKCYKGRRMTDGRTFAIKAISLNEQKEASKEKSKGSRHHPRVSTQQKAVAEAKFIKTCQHPNIISYVTNFIYDNVFYIVMEYCQNGSVGDLLKRRKSLTEVEARYYIRQMVEGLIYIRSKKIIHRDLKPANYLLTENLQLKIADFGLATEVRNNQPVFTNVCGTPNYLSPEMLAKKSYSYEVDVWSVGVALYAMLFGMPPFETKKKDAHETYAKIKKCEYSFSHQKVSISDEAKDLISRILVIDPNRRISLQKILDHPFMSCYKIPRELSEKCLKKEPDSKFLKRYEYKMKDKHEKYEMYRGKSEPSKEKEFMSIKQPMRFCPPEEYEKEERTSKSFSDSASLKYENNLEDKKQLKKRKSEAKEKQQIERKKPKSMAEAIQKLQKEEMLTSSPISSNYSMKSSSMHNKYVQYPSDNPISNPEFVQIKVQQIAMSSKISNQNKIDFESVKQNETEEENIIEEVQECNIQDVEYGIQQIPFPSFRHMMKQLSFDQDFWRNQNDSKNFNLDHKDFVQSILKKKIGIKKEFTPDQRYRSRSKKIQLQIQQAQPKYLCIHHVNDNIYSLEDFLICTSSLHLTTQKLIKIVYCLKEEKLTDSIPQKLTSSISSNQPKSRTKLIGSIFFDNSSIVTKINYVGKEVQYSSIYIRNVEMTYQHKNFHNLGLIDSLPQFDYENILKGQNQFAIDLDIFELQKKGVSKQKMNYDMRLKMKLAKDGIKLFKKHLIKSFPELFDKKLSYPIIPETKSEKETNKIDYFNFIRMFQSHKSGLYLELNDFSKHYLEKKLNPKNHLDLFRNTEETIKMKSYQYAIYFSVKKVAFMRKVGEEKFTMFNTDELKFNKQENKQKLKECQEEHDEQNFYEKCSKKIKPNEQGYQSLNSQKSIKELSQSLVKLNELQANEILTKICNEFRQKLDMFYIRQRDTHLQKKSPTKNRFCEIGIEKGMLDFRMDKIKA